MVTPKGRVPWFSYINQGVGSVMCFDVVGIAPARRFRLCESLGAQQEKQRKELIRHVSSVYGHLGPGTEGDEARCADISGWPVINSTS